MTESEDKKLIGDVLQNYFSGYLNAESDLVSKAFHSETNLFSVDNEKLDKTTMTDWIKNIRSRKEKGDLRQAHSEIMSIDVTDSAAVAKVSLTFAKFKFTDYLSLLRIEGSWRIIGKIYTTKNIP